MKVNATYDAPEAQTPVACPVVVDPVDPMSHRSRRRHRGRRVWDWGPTVLALIAILIATIILLAGKL